jgi:hypothetical protein
MLDMSDKRVIEIILALKMLILVGGEEVANVCRA